MEAPIRAVIAYVIFVLVALTHSESIQPRAQQLVRNLGLSGAPVTARADVQVESALRAAGRSPGLEVRPALAADAEATLSEARDAGFEEKAGYTACRQLEARVATRLP